MDVDTISLQGRTALATGRASCIGHSIVVLLKEPEPQLGETIWPRCHHRSSENAMHTHRRHRPRKDRISRRRCQLRKHRGPSVADSCTEYRQLGAGARHQLTRHLSGLTCSGQDPIPLYLNDHIFVATKSA